MFGVCFNGVVYMFASETMLSSVAGWLAAWLLRPIDGCEVRDNGLQKGMGGRKQDTRYEVRDARPLVARYVGGCHAHPACSC